jgi:hypothetical protein
MRLFTAVNVLRHHAKHSAQLQSSAFERLNEFIDGRLRQMVVNVVHPGEASKRVAFSVVVEDPEETRLEACARIVRMLSRPECFLDAILAEPAFEGSSLREPTAAPSKAIPLDRAEAARLERLEKGCFGYLRCVVASAAIDGYRKAQKRAGVAPQSVAIAAADDLDAGDEETGGRESEGGGTGPGGHGSARNEPGDGGQAAAHLHSRMDLERVSARARQVFDSCLARTTFGWSEQRALDARNVADDLVTISTTEDLTFKVLLVSDLVATEPAAAARLAERQEGLRPALATLRRAVGSERFRRLEVAVRRADPGALREWLEAVARGAAKLDADARAPLEELSAFATEIEALLAPTPEAGKARRNRVDQRVSRLRRAILDAVADYHRGGGLDDDDRELARAIVTWWLRQNRSSQNGSVDTSEGT